MMNVENYREWPIIVIADDLTGANEIGISLAEHKKKTFILSEQLRDEDVESLSDRYNSLVVNLGSRHLDGKDAYKRVKDFLNQLLY